MNKYTVGKYVIVPEKPFSSMEEAVQYIQNKHPELDTDTIKKHLSPKIDGNNQSNNSIEESTDGQKTSAKDSAASFKGVKPGKDKSG